MSSTRTRTSVLSLSARRSIGWRLFTATALVALAGGLTQTAWAAPHEGHGAGMQGHGGHGGHGAHAGMGMGMAGGGRMVERMLDTVNATPEQRAQIRKIVETARAEGAAQHDARRQLHAQSLALMSQPQIDARAAEALRQQMVAQHDQASKRRLQVMLDVSRVLTPEQRKTLADRMTQRRAMMERHRAERGTLEQAPR